MNKKMNELCRKIREDFLNIIVIVSIITIIVLIIFWVIKVPFLYSRPKSIAQETETENKLNKRTTMDFSKVIIEKFNEQSELVVLSADASVDVDLEQAGFFDWDILNKSQKINYSGSGEYYVDLSAMGTGNILVDNDAEVVKIIIPHTKLKPLEIDPDRLKIYEAEKGLLAFGDLKFTVQEYNKLEKEVKSRFTETIDTEENKKKADEQALIEMGKIYEPVVKNVDSNYSVEIDYVN